MVLSERLARWSGSANIVGGILLALFFVLHPGGGDPPSSARVVLDSPYTLEHLLGLAGMALLLLGLPAISARTSERGGWLARLALPLAFVGNYLLGGVLFFDAFITPPIAANAPAMLDATGPLNSPPTVVAFAVAGALWGLGYLLLAIEALRSTRLPRWASALVVVGSVVANLPPEPIGFAPLSVIALGAVLLGVGLSGWGRDLCSRTRSTHSPEPRARTLPAP